MVNLPLDVLVAYCYKMDVELIENNLDESGIYAGMNLNDFISMLKEKFAELHAQQVKRINPVLGKKAGSNRLFIGFETHPGSNILLPFTVEAMEDMLTVVSIQDLQGFEKTGDMRSRVSF